MINTAFKGANKRFLGLLLLLGILCSPFLVTAETDYLRDLRHVWTFDDEADPSIDPVLGWEASQSAGTNSFNGSVAMNGSSYNFKTTGFLQTNNNLDEPAGGDSRTFVTWYYPNKNPGDWTSILFQGTTGDGNQLQLDIQATGYFYLSRSSGGCNGNIIDPVNLNDWNFFAIVINGTTLDDTKVFLNDEVVNCSGASIWGTDTGHTFKWNGYGLAHTNGQVDETYIWNRTLTDEEINGLRDETNFYYQWDNSEIPLSLIHI